jgi:radical SAM superfamily enzyme YgiQ (UPF0313 family)
MVGMKGLMNILLLYPEFPDTFWSFKHALKFVGKKTALPPLGLLTVAGMLPSHWSKRLVDTNVRRLRKEDLEWADGVFISAMTIQRDSARRLISECKAAGLMVVAGGPLFQTEEEQMEGVDHFILNEAELTLPPFLADLAAGKAQRVYSSDRFADLGRTPPPMWELLEQRRYASMAVQFSRGCPFNCDFCNVTALLGRQVRLKSTQQILAELDGLYASGWRGDVFFVDDNFIGNKRVLKESLLPALAEWRKGKPSFLFFTEASINLAGDPELMKMMVTAGFRKVFVGIETPNEESLAECNKVQNKHRDLVEDVKTIQRAGLEVQAGFIVGFDHDSPAIFQRQIEFIQNSGIVTAMVGLLQAPPGTRLYRKLKEQGRLLGEPTGDNVDGSTNVATKMSLKTLQEGYRSILDHIYSPKFYYERIKTFLREYRPPPLKNHLNWSHIKALFRSFYRLGVLGKERFYYWKLLLWTQFRYPRLFPEAVILAIYGYHFRKVCEQRVSRPDP